jgi:hypothetical protein
MTIATLRALVRFFFTGVGWDVLLQEDGSQLVRDNHGDCWRVRVEKIK